MKLKIARECKLAYIHSPSKTFFPVLFQMGITVISPHFSDSFASVSILSVWESLILSYSYFFVLLLHTLLL